MEESGGGRKMLERGRSGLTIDSSIPGESESIISELNRILGKKNEGIFQEANLDVKVWCSRSSHDFGHLATVEIIFSNNISAHEIIEAWQNFSSDRDYGLPSWWGPDWLVLATSYSGNTEETIDGIEEALQSGGTVIGISSGGKLEKLISENEESLFLSVPGGQMPRSAFGHLFGRQLSVCWALGIIEKPDDKDILKMIERLRSSSTDFDISGGNGLVVSVAKSMLNRQIGIIAPTILIPAARRFANQ